MSRCGRRTFRHEPDPVNLAKFRFIEATDPLGGTEHLEFHGSNASIAATETSEEVPAAFSSANANLDFYLTFYWDKRAWLVAPGDLASATMTKWLLGFGDLTNASEPSTSVPHSVKKPLENRVWYAYPGQEDPAGTWIQPSATARVFDDGATQTWAATYNDHGMVSRTDPLGRRTSSTYASNGIDLLEVRQTTGSLNDLLATYGDYTATHLPQTITDAAGQTSTMAYTASGQPLTITNAKGETTAYVYAPDRSLQSVTGPVTGATTSYTYGGYGRVRTVTTSDGYTVTDYDVMDRPTRLSYPDDTFDQITYDRLDLTERRDRLGRVTRTFYDAAQRVIAIRIRSDACSRRSGARAGA